WLRMYSPSVLNWSRTTSSAAIAETVLSPTSELGAGDGERRSPRGPRAAGRVAEEPARGRHPPPGARLRPGHRAAQRPRDVRARGRGGGPGTRPSPRRGGPRGRGARYGGG